MGSCMRCQELEKHNAVLREHKMQTEARCKRYREALEEIAVHAESFSKTMPRNSYEQWARTEARAREALCD